MSKPENLPDVNDLPFKNDKNLSLVLLIVLKRYHQML